MDEAARRRAADQEAWQVLRPILDAPGAAGYLPWTEGAIRPAALVRVLNEIVFANRREIVELGAGVSTVVLARLLRERDGRLATLEHDANWAGVVGDQLTREGLDGTVTLIDAPLEPSPRSFADAPWYSSDALAMLPASGVDLLLIDGPPGYGEGMAHSRYPGLPVLADRLAPGCLVFLDDAVRDGEQQILARWSAEHPEWEFGIDADAGIAVGRKP